MSKNEIAKTNSSTPKHYPKKTTVTNVTASENVTNTVTLNPDSGEITKTISHTQIVSQTTISQK